MSKNINLSKAKKEKNDEFYTQLPDIENELRHYKKHFKDKVIFCNCDDPYESNFFKYFAMNFNHLKLKKLISTTYNKDGNGNKLEIVEVKDENVDGAIDLVDIEYLLKRGAVTPLEGDGDFNSDECIELLKEADIVITNPPFSLFRGYVAQLIEYDKQFLIIGNMNAITYKEIFPLLKNNRMWVGHNYVKEFTTAEGLTKKFGNILWYTNLKHDKLNATITLYKKYTSEEYPKYDNYDAINVNKVVDIPYDYDGAMGVPITFLTKYNPEQFEIIGCSYSYGEPKGYHFTGKGFNVGINKKQVYKRLFIKRRGD